MLLTHHTSQPPPPFGSTASSKTTGLKFGGEDQAVAVMACLASQFEQPFSLPAPLEQGVTMRSFANTPGTRDIKAAVANTAETALPNILRRKECKVFQGEGEVEQDLRET